MRAKISCSSASTLLLLVFCGVYEVNGYVRFQPHAGYRITLAEGSKSETVFKVPPTLNLRILPYKDLPVRARVLLAEPPQGTQGEVSEIESIEMRVPDPLQGPADSNFTLKERRECKNRVR